MPIKSTAKPAAAKPAAAKPAPSKPAPAAAASAPVKTVSKEAVATVTTTILENGSIKGEPVVSEEREIKTFVTDTSTVGVNLGYNRNLGNMEMVKVTAFVSMPCYVEEVDNAGAQVIDKAKALLEAALAEMPDTFSQAGEDPTVTEGEAEETGEAPAEEGEEGALTIDDIKGYDEEGLAALCAANEDWGVTPSDYPEVDDLREVIIGIAFPDDLEAYQAERAAAAEGGGEEGGTEESTGYTREELEAEDVTLDDLKTIFEGWSLGAFPKGPPAVAKKAAIAKILKKQEESMGAG